MVIRQMDKCLCCGSLLTGYTDPDLEGKYCPNDECPLFADDVEPQGTLVNVYYINKIKMLWAKTQETE